MLSKKSLLLAAAAVVALFPAPRLQAQKPAPTPTLTVNARLVVLDVTVTDKQGKPVTDLTAADFQVYEAGKLERIRSFEPPSAHTLPSGSAPAQPTEAFDAAHPASFGNSPVEILLLDQLNTHFADSSFARRSLREYLASQPELLPLPTDLLSLTEIGLKPLEGFTRSRDKLLKALDATPVKYDWRLELNGKADYGPIERLDLSLRALEQIAEGDAMLHGRKNVVWVGGGFPTLDTTILDSDDAKEVNDTLRHITDVLLERRVTLYAVDPATLLPGVTEIVDTTEIAFATAAGDSISSIDPFDRNGDFNRLAPVTGGRVVRGMNDIAAQIGTLASLAGDYYTMAYTPEPGGSEKQQYRKIRVVCLRPGLTATTREGYYPASIERDSSAATAAYDLTTAATGVVALHGLDVSVEPAHAGDPNGTAWVVRVRAPGLTWQYAASGEATASVYVMAVSLDGKQRMLGHTIAGMTAKAKAGTDLRDPKRQADFLLVAPPKAKTASLRFIVRDSATGRMGSFDLPVSRP